MFATETNEHAASFASPACTPPAAPAPPAPVRCRLARAGAGGPARRQPAGAAGLSGQADPAGRPVPAGQRFRHHGAHRGAKNGRAEPLQRAGGQPPRRRRPPGRGQRRPVCARCPYARAGADQQPGHQPHALPRRALWPAQGPGAGGAAVVLAHRAGHVPEVGLQDLCRCGRCGHDAARYPHPPTCPAHRGGNLAGSAAGIRRRHIPYKGAAQGVTDLVGGQIDLYISSVPTLLGQVRNGRLRALAITSARRSGQLPDTPTLAESGYPGFDVTTWYGILAPAGTPAAIVQQLNQAINQALAQPDVAEKLRSEGGEVLGGSAERFAELLRTEVTRWGKIVKDSGASMNCLLVSRSCAAANHFTHPYPLPFLFTGDATPWTNFPPSFVTSSASAPTSSKKPQPSRPPFFPTWRAGAAPCMAAWRRCTSACSLPARPSPSKCAPATT